MNSLTANTSMKESLASANGLTEVRDDQGNVIGYFSPAKHAASSLYSQAAAHFDVQEMQERKQSGKKGCTTEQVLKHLDALEE